MGDPPACSDRRTRPAGGGAPYADEELVLDLVVLPTPEPMRGGSPGEDGPGQCRVMGKQLDHGWPPLAARGECQPPALDD